MDSDDVRRELEDTFGPDFEPDGLPTIEAMAWGLHDWAHRAPSYHQTVALGDEGDDMRILLSLAPRDVLLIQLGLLLAGGITFPCLEDECSALLDRIQEISVVRFDNEEEFNEWSEALERYYFENTEGGEE